MPTLELAVDARALQTGLAQADSALERTGNKALEAQRDLRSLGSSSQVAGNNLQAAFAATGGGLSVTRGIVGIGDGLRSANSAMATFAASQALLDFGRLGADFREAARGVGATGGAFSALGSVIKANPILFLATTLAGVAAAMGLFREETEKTATEWDRLGESIRKAQLSDATKQLISGQAQAGRASQIESLIGQIGLGQGRPSFTPGALAASLGISSEDLESRRQGIVRGLGPLYYGRPTRDDLFTKGIATQIAIEVYREIRNNASLAGRDRPLSFGASEFSFDAPVDTVPYYLRGGPGPRPGAQGAYGGSIGFALNTALRVGPATESARQAQEEAARAMDELIRKGQEFGATIGDAFFNVASGAQTARQAIAGIVADLARAASRQAFASLFGQVAGSFGRTGTQTAQNAPPPNQNASNFFGL